MGFLSAISGVFTSWFGLKKLYDIIKKFSQAKKLVKEIEEAYDELDDIPAAYAAFEMNARAALKDKKVTKEELERCIKEGYKLVKETKEFINEARDIVEIFR